MARLLEFLWGFFLRLATPLKTSRNAMVLTALLGGLFCGCSSLPEAPAVAPLKTGAERLAAEAAARRMSSMYPPAYRAVQRAIIDVKGREFTCDAVLRAVPGEGHRLALVSRLGVVTEVRLPENGRAEAMKVTPLFRREWAEAYVARDLEALFVPPSTLTPAGTLSDGSLVLVARAAAGGDVRYVFSADGGTWKSVEAVRDGKAVFRAKALGWRRFEGHSSAMPGGFEVEAGAYRMNLRTVTLSVTPMARKEDGR